MLGSKWQADYCDGEKCRQEKMHQCQFKTWQNYPDNIHDDGYSTAGWFFFAYFVTERSHTQNGKFEALNPERNTYDGNT